MTAKPRKPLSESLKETELTPEMEAFRKGNTIPEKVEQVVEAKKLKHHRKLVVELEDELYDAFATVCFKKRKKMAQVVRAFIEEYAIEE